MGTQSKMRKPGMSTDELKPDSGRPAPGAFGRHKDAERKRAANVEKRNRRTARLAKLALKKMGITAVQKGPSI